MAEENNNYLSIEEDDLLIDIPEVQPQGEEKQDDPPVEEKKKDSEPAETEDELIDIEEGKNIEPSDNEDNSKGASSPSSSASDNLYKAFAEDLASEGFFSEFTEEEWNKIVEEKGSPAEAFKSLKEQQVEKMKEQYIEGLSDEDKELYQAKVKGIPLDELGVLNNRIQQLKNMSEEQISEDEALQENIIETYLLENTSSDEETIKDLIETYKDKDKLKDQSLAAYKKLSEKAKNEKENFIKKQEEKIAQQETQRKESLKKLENNVNSLKEIVPGLELNKNEKEAIYKSMTKAVYTDDKGIPYDAVSYNRMKNPEAFDIAMHYYNKMGLFNFDSKGNFKPDFSKITRIETNKKVRSKFDEIVEGNKLKGKISSQSKEKTSTLGNEFLDKKY